MYTEKRPTGELEVYDYMTEEEIRTYNYIYNKFGARKSNEYLESLINKKNYYISVEGTLRENEDGLNYRWGLIDASDDNFLEKMANSIGVGLTRLGINIAQLFSSEAMPMTKNEYRYEVTLSQSGRAEKILYQVFHNVGKNYHQTFLHPQLEFMVKEDIISVNSKAVSRGIIESAGEKIAAVDYVMKKVSKELQTLCAAHITERRKNDNKRSNPQSGRIKTKQYRRRNKECLDMCPRW